MIDTHAHLFSCKRPLDEIVSNARAVGITHIINVGLNRDTWLQAQLQSQQYPGFIFPTAGLYPGQEKNSAFLEEIEQLARTRQIAAIGEIGLDYFRVTLPKTQQIDLFETQLDIALRTQYPVIIHNRNADEDIVEICKNFSGVKKVFHCFGSGPNHIDKLMSNSTYFSFTATLSFADKGEAIDGLNHIPLDRIMIETDCPYLTPRVYGKTENQPANVLHTAKKVAEIKGVSLEEFLATSTQTALSFFKGLPSA